jgi:hypothetical protein
LILREAVFDRNILTLDIAGILQALTKRGQKIRIIATRPAAEEPYYRDRRLLCADGERPRRRRASENRDEFTSSHLCPEDAARGSLA